MFALYSELVSEEARLVNYLWKHWPKERVSQINVIDVVIAMLERARTRDMRFAVTGTNNENRTEKKG